MGQMEFARLPGGNTFSRVFDEGRTCVGRRVVLCYRRRASGPFRAGFAAGKKLGPAVTRNRLRRRMREALRSLPGRGNPADVVLLARRHTAKADFSRLRSEIRDLLNRAGLLAEDRPAEEGIPRRT